MAIVAPTVDIPYLQQPLPKGRRALVSQMEISCATAPHYLGKLEAKKYGYDTYAGFLMASGNEITVPAEQISWKEELSNSNVIQVVGENLVSRTGNDFTINASAIPSDPYDIDTCRPENAQFFTVVGQRFLAVDNTGERNVGVVTSISTDGKTITADIRGEEADWTVATTNLDIIFLNQNLGHCEPPSCIGYKNYSPTYENSFVKDAVCVDYCEETLIAEGGWEAFPEEQFGEFTFTPNQRNDDALMRLTKQTDASLAWEVRTPKSVADAVGEPQGMKGIFQQLDERALKIEGELTTLDDLVTLSTFLKKQEVYECYLDATPSQYGKLMKIMTANVSIQWNPFENHQGDLMYLGYKGIDVYGVKIMFREWKGLSGRGSEKLGKKYHYVITPADTVNVTLMGKKRNLGRVTLVWFGNENAPYKMKRESNENDYNSGNIKIDYYNKYSVIVLGANQFVLGVSA